MFKIHYYPVCENSSWCYWKIIITQNWNFWSREKEGIVVMWVKGINPKLQIGSGVGWYTVWEKLELLEKRYSRRWRVWLCYGALWIVEEILTEVISESNVGVHQIWIMVLMTKEKIR